MAIDTPAIFGHKLAGECGHAGCRDVAESAGFAFAGTVAAIDGSGDNSLPSGDLVSVRLDGVEWTVGRGNKSVLVALGTPVADGYREGTRLLVSGDHFSGPPSYLAWGCGFTRYFCRPGNRELLVHCGSRG